MDDPKQPAIKAPWPVVLLVLAIVGSYLVQSVWVDETALVITYGFAPIMLHEGRYLPLVTSMFLHGGWTHAGMNALGAMAFGAPTARLLGLGYQSAQGRAPAVGGLAFLLFFLLCGVLGSLGYGLLHSDGQAILIGASGGVAGLLHGLQDIPQRWRDALRESDVAQDLLDHLLQEDLLLDYKG